jgi:hypothetical protein
VVLVLVDPNFAMRRTRERELARDNRYAEEAEAEAEAEEEEKGGEQQ